MVTNVIGQLAGLDKSVEPQGEGLALNCPSLVPWSWAGPSASSRWKGTPGPSSPSSPLSPNLLSSPLHWAEYGDPRARVGPPGQDLLPQRSQT